MMVAMVACSGFRWLEVDKTNSEVRVYFIKDRDLRTDSSREGSFNTALFEEGLLFGS